MPLRLYRDTRHVSEDGLDYIMPILMSKGVNPPLHVRSTSGSGPTSFGGGLKFPSKRPSGTSSAVL